jgi:hypothetical protein
LNIYSFLNNIKSKIPFKTTIGINPNVVIPEGELPCCRLEPISLNYLNKKEFIFRFYTVLLYSLTLKTTTSSIEDVYKTAYDTEELIRLHLHLLQAENGIIEFQELNKIDNEYMQNRIILFTEYQFKGRLRCL